MLYRSISVLAMAAIVASGAFAQKTTNFTYSITLTDEKVTATRHAEGSGVGSLGSLGMVHIHLELAQGIAPNVSPASPIDDFKGTISFVFNRLDSFDVAVTIPNGNGSPPPINGTITGGKGAYQGATGSVTFTITGFNAAQPRTVAFITAAYQIAATGSVTVAGKTTTLTLSASQMVTPGSRDDFLDTNTGTFTISPLGSGTITLAGSGGDNNTRQSTFSIFKFNDTDSITGLITFLGEVPLPASPGVIVGGTGAYAGATGSFMVANIVEAPDGKSVTVTGSGAITTGATGLPISFLPTPLQRESIGATLRNLLPAKCPRICKTSA
jgi:hypothetical protein